MRLPRLAALVLPLALLAAGCAALAPEAPKVAAAPAEVRSILWVGNSFFYYNNSMHNHVGQLGRGLKPAVAMRGVSVTISGSGLDWHDVDSYLRPDGIGRYSFVSDNQIRFNPPGRQFDAVVMMDCSQCPVHPELKGAFAEHARKKSAAIARYGARPVLFMSWAYKDKPEMTQQLADAYVAAAKDGNAQVIPAGLAFARAIAGRPQLELYAPDKRHPSLAGTYLAASTVFAAMTGLSPVDSGYTAGLDPELARYLRQVAWDTVRQFPAK